MQDGDQAGCAAGTDHETLRHQLFQDAGDDGAQDDERQRLLEDAAKLDDECRDLIFQHLLHIGGASPPEPGGRAHAATTQVTPAKVHGGRLER